MANSSGSLSMLPSGSRKLNSIGGCSNSEVLHYNISHPNVDVQTT